MRIPKDKLIVITAGETWVDIDAYACIIAYKYLLDKLKIESVSYIPGTLNESITKSVLNLGFNYADKLDGNPHDFNFIMVDISEPGHFVKQVILDNVIAVYDHRYGFEDYWEERIGSNAKIEMVGSCATLIFEEFEKQGVKIDDQGIAKLLQYAILSNTLNFKAGVTTNRDKAAFEKLGRIAKWSDSNWIKEYYNQAEQEIMVDPIKAIENDTKKHTINGKSFVIAQIELWESRDFVNDYQKSILKYLRSQNADFYFLTSPSISEGINYLVTDSEGTKNLLYDLLEATFDGYIGTTNKLYLRKEVMYLLKSKQWDSK